MLVGGETGLTFANVDLTGAVSGYGATEFTCDQSLDFNRAEIELDFDDRREIGAGLLEVVPPLENALDQWLVGDLFDWIVQTGQMNASFETGSDLSAAIAEVNDQLAFTAATGQVAIRTQVESSTRFAGNLAVSVYGVRTRFPGGANIQPRPGLAAHPSPTDALYPPRRIPPR